MTIQSVQKNKDAGSGVLARAKHVHFIGIGGIGVSAIARMCMHEGKTVSGSDRSSSRITEELAADGAIVFYTQEAKNIVDSIDCVVYTVAMPEDHPELVAAREKGIETITYAQALGEISSDKFTIAVSGTHGKTTTTAMIAKILIDAGLDPTVIVGSLLIDQKSNFIAGKSSILVVEACEYKRSFLDINPDIIVVTNIEADHLDYYRDLEEIQDAFKQFIGKLSDEGTVVANICHEHVGSVVEDTFAHVVDYSELSIEKELTVPGAHNCENAKAALAVAEVLHIDPQQALDSVVAFKGTWRRFERKGEITGTGIPVFDDYAHHPTEVAATLSGARDAYTGRRIVVIFQPHLYSRTKILLNDFATAFASADRVIMLPIYAAREAHDPSISSELLAAEIQRQDRSNIPVVLAKDLVEAERLAREQVQEFSALDEASVVITMGAGDVSLISDSLTKNA